ncbi:MAG: PH domain-containing protein [Ruminococcaceae bacterium]|nr:PH domain-containing protein [Oscillospiraceae bacterium]
MDTNYIWHDRKRIFFGLPWTFTTYGLNENSLFIKRGIFNISEEEIRLYRILDITLKRSFWERLFGLGTLHLCTADKSTPEIDILHIPAPKEVRTLLSDKVEEARSERYVGVREFIGDEEDGDLH